MTEDKRTISVELPPGEAVRADRYISGLDIMKRSQFESHKLQAFLGGKEIKLSRKLKNGDVLEISWERPDEPDYEPEKMDLDIVFENDEVLVINKKQGVVVHPGAGNHRGTLVQGLLYYNQQLGNHFQNDPLRPGIVHRLDKDTSGLIITAKNPESLEALAEQFRQRTTEKYYLAIVKGRLPRRHGDIETFITRDEKNRKKFKVHDSKGKEAVTRYTVLKAWERYSLVQLKIETGRTHQIRVHMLSMGCPILGDSIYARKDNVVGDVGLMLHSWKLGIVLPGETEMRHFEAPRPPRFDEIIERLDLMERS
ncbi:MAG: RluA family pseudouridine synthase [Spirochaetales bacterium]|nr:RluA family pseudouridine synthase [Spirochaetales bacterium]